MWVRSRLHEVVLPSNNISFATPSLRELATLLGIRQVSYQEWLEAVRTIFDLKEEVVDIYFRIGCDYFVHAQGDIHEGCFVPGHFLVLVLFLQGAGRRKEVGEKRERKTDEETLCDHIVSRMKIIQEIFPDRTTLFAVLVNIFDTETGCLEEALDSIDLNNIASLLVPDPQGVVSCIKSGKKLTWKMGNSNNHHSSKAKMATTAHLPGRKMIVLSQLEKQILAKNSYTVSGSTVSLHRSKFSNIYLVTYLDSITINKSSSSTIFTGPVKNTVRISGCRNLTVVTLAKRIIIQECLDCIFFIFTPNRPVMSSTCHNITLAPFNTNYLGLEQDMIKVNLNKESHNEWNNPVLMTTTTRNIFSVVQPSDFYSFCLPFSSYLSGSFLPLPTEYMESNNEKENVVTDWEKVKVEATLSSQEEALLESLVKKEYNEYLESFSDLRSGLKHLVALEQNIK